ncbi:MAG TPA: HAD family hydrolase [Conexibacter sp.]|nr:HAD family hydrolase [Conexibacter sp.]
MPRAVLFDLDGTLMDHDAARDAGFAAHLPGQHALAEEWRRLEAIHYDEYAAGRISFTEQRRRRVRGIHAAMGDAEPADEACDAWFAGYLGHYRGAWRAFDDVIPALAALAAADPDLGLGVVTNGEGEPQRAKLAAIGLTERFPVFVASAEVGLRKPDPEIFLHACELLGAAPEDAAHVGDRLDLDARGAVAAGLRGIWLDRDSDGEDAGSGVATVRTLLDLPAVLVPSAG